MPSRASRTETPLEPRRGDGPSISAVIITCDESDLVEPCLQSVAAWVDEIVVVDMHSTDGTREIVRRFTDRLIDHERLPFVEPARGFALAQARGDWIIMLDPDERVPPSLGRELRIIAGQDDVDVVFISCPNVQFGRVMRSQGASDFRHPRFFRRGALDWPGEIHGVPDLTGCRQRFLPMRQPNLALRHEHWRSVPAVLDRLQRYPPGEVKRLQASGQRFSPASALRAVYGEFVSRLFDGRAYDDGMAGLLTVLYHCVYQLTVQAELWEAEGRPERFDHDVRLWGRRAATLYRLTRRPARLLAISLLRPLGKGSPDV